MIRKPKNQDVDISGKATIIQGDCADVLRRMPAGIVHCCVTSPPYWGLRDYGVEGQIGLEKTPEEYVAKMVAVFREVRRVLRDDGTLWLNLGDSYAGSYSGGTQTKTTTSTLGSNRDGLSDDNYIWKKPHPPRQTPDALKPKDLVGIPWRVAFALQADGWYLRQDIIWHKPNVMPESVTDRCTKAHEYVFLLAKSERYYYDANAIAEKSVCGPRVRLRDNGISTSEQKLRGGAPDCGGGVLRNRRSVWTVNTKPYRGAHFATFPPELVEPCILAGSPAQCCAKCGRGWVKKKGAEFATQACGCDSLAGSVPGCVLDPFSGTATTGAVARHLKRKYIGIELNAKYIALSWKRVQEAE